MLLSVPYTSFVFSCWRRPLVQVRALWQRVPGPQVPPYLNIKYSQSSQKTHLVWPLIVSSAYYQVAKENCFHVFPHITWEYSNMCGFCMYMNNVIKWDRGAQRKREKREGRRNLMWESSKSKVKWYQILCKNCWFYIDTPITISEWPDILLLICKWSFKKPGCSN